MPPYGFQLNPLLRRRRTADFMTPGINPDAELPEMLPPPRPTLRAPLGALTRMPDTGMEDNPPPPRPPAMPDMGNAPLPEFRAPMTRGDEYYGRKAEYLAGAPGRGKSALIGALEGLGRGEGLIGAAAGGLTGAISPRRLREQQFEQRIRPQMMERFAFEDQARAQQAAEAKAGQESALNQARIGELNRRNLPQPPRPAAPLRGRPGDVFLDPETRAPIARIPQEPRQPTSAELQVDPESGLSYEEMADASYQGRGGDEYVRSKLSPRTRQILEAGTVTDEGKVNKDGTVSPGKTTRQADPEEIEAAQREFDSAIRRQRATDLQYSRGAVRANVLRGKRPKQQTPIRKGKPGRRAISVQEAAELLK